MTTRSRLPRVTMSILQSIEGRGSQDSHGLSVSSGVGACVSSNPTHPPASPTSIILSPKLPCALFLLLGTRKPYCSSYYIVIVLQCTSGNPLLLYYLVHCSSDPSLMPSDASQAEKTNDEDSLGIASYQLLYRSLTGWVHTGTVIKVTQTRPGSLRYINLIP